MTAIEMLKSAIAEQACDDDTFQQYAFWIRKIYHHPKRGESPMDFGRNLRQFQMPPQITFN